MPKYILSPEAKKSLKKIRNYTLENHGKQQTKIYLKMLRDQMKNIAAKPEVKGTSRNEIKESYYGAFAEKHTIYYRIQPTHIDIIDILHQNMEPSKHL